MTEKPREGAIRAEKLTYAYEELKGKRHQRGEKPRPAVADVNLTLYEGEAAAIRGSNGAGKTTLGKLLTGIIKPSLGKVVIFGKDAGEMSLSEIGGKIGYGFQNPERQLFASTVEEEIGFGLYYGGMPKEKVSRITEGLIKLFQLEACRDSFPLNLSYGEKKRVALAAALALSPEYLILDEPTLGLDARRIDILNQVLEELKSRGTGMLIISHNEEFIRQITSRVLTMERGQIIDDRKI
ncbi:hypothetical protein MASR2M70_09350 [Bacillota bacterium]